MNAFLLTVLGQFCSQLRFTCQSAQHCHGPQEWSDYGPCNKPLSRKGVPHGVSTSANLLNLLNL